MRSERNPAADAVPLPQAIGWLGLMSPNGPKEEVYTATQMCEHAALVRAATLEEAAALVDREGYSHTSGLNQFVANAFERTADAIRALKSVQQQPGNPRQS